MRKSLAAICAAFLLILVVVPIAHAATEVNVRIEGKEETLFEKTIPVGIEKIESSSDDQKRGCDGVNELDPENVEPGITPTLASAEAMASIGESFDGEWYEGFGDYFITRWGPDEQDNALSAWWGIFVNNALTSVGGCQYQLDQDDEVLWLWNAFSNPSRPLLALFPEAANYTEGARPTRVTVAPGEPVPLEVVAYPAGGEGVVAESPSRAGSSAYEGAEIAPVTVNAKGFQRIDTASPEAVTSDAEGKASLTYDTPGLYRIKATAGGPGIEETAVRSNGLEICVETRPGECEPATTPVNEGAPPTTPPPSGAGTTPSPTLGAAQIGKPRLDRSGLASGRLRLNWKVLDAGAGLKSWTVATKTIGRKSGWVSRAHGTTETGATVRLGRGWSFRVRLTVIDLSGHTTAYDLGKVTVPPAGRS